MKISLFFLFVVLCIPIGSKDAKSVSCIYALLREKKSPRLKSKYTIKHRIPDLKKLNLQGAVKEFSEISYPVFCDDRGCFTADAFGWGVEDSDLITSRFTPTGFIKEVITQSENHWIERVVYHYDGTRDYKTVDLLKGERQPDNGCDCSKPMIAEYDSRGNIVKETALDSNFNAKPEQIDYVYEFDRCNNWVMRLKFQDDTPVFVTYRTILYYDGW